MLGPPPPFPVGGGGPWIGMGNQNQSSEVAVLLQPRLDDDAPSPLPVLLLVGTTPRGNACFAFKIKKGDAYLFHKNYGVHAIMQPLSMNGNIKGLFIGFMI